MQDLKALLLFYFGKFHIELLIIARMFVSSMIDHDS